MEEKDKVVAWLACDEIESMVEYVEELKNDRVPFSARIAVWGLAFTKTWHKRIERPAPTIYNTFLKCQKQLPCPDCYRKEQKQLEAQEETKDTVVEAIKSAVQPEKAEKTKGAEAGSSPKEEKEKKPAQNEEQEKEPEEGNEHMLSDEEIEEILAHLDCGFAKEEGSGKTEKDRCYTIRVVMYALKKSYEYSMLVAHKRVNPRHVDKIFCLCVGAFSYFTNSHIEKIFKVAFFLASNLNGVFLTKKAQDMTKKELDKFLLFVQNTSALSRNKFVMLIDILSTLNQETLANFVLDIVEGKVSVSSLQKSLFDKYSGPSAQEIDSFWKKNPFSLPSAFVPRVIILHQKENKTLEELKQENASLKENIETLLGDLKYANTSGFAAQLKKELEEKNEQIKQLKNSK